MEQQSNAQMLEGLRRDVQRLSEGGVSAELRSAAVAYYRLRVEQGATQGEAAEELGINRWSLAKWWQKKPDRPRERRATFELDAEGAQLKEEIDRIGPRSPSRRYPEELKKRVSSWASAHRARGARVGALAKTVGIPWESLSRWTGERPVGAKPKSKPQLREVAVVADHATLSGVVLRTPKGFWVEGLDAPTLLELLGKLG